MTRRKEAETLSRSPLSSAVLTRAATQPGERGAILLSQQ